MHIFELIITVDEYITLNCLGMFQKLKVILKTTCNLKTILLSLKQIIKYRYKRIRNLNPDYNLCVKNGLFK